MNIPSLPAEISPDGREVWDWAAKLSAQVHRADEIRKLAAQIHNAENQCGSCSKWMTSACPREVHSNKTGRSTGPSSLAFKCSQFSMTGYTQRDTDAAKAKLASLQQSPKEAKAIDKAKEPLASRENE